MQCLKKNIQLSGYTNVEVAELALGDRMGVAPMFMSRRANWHSFYPTHASTGTRNVDMATVDHFVRSRESPTFVRMDVEGFELAILKGMTETLPRLHRLFIEIHADIMRLDDTRDLIARLRTQGFRVQFMVRYDYPGLSRVLPNDHIESVLRGDKGNYEVFFERG